MSKSDEKAIEQHKKKLPLWVKIVIAVALVIYVNLSGFIIGMIASMFGNEFYASFIIIVAAITSLFIVLLLFVQKRKWLLKALLWFVLLVAVIIAGRTIYSYMRDNAVIVSTRDVYVWQYSPFLRSGDNAFAVNDLLAQLDGEASLRFSAGDYLPKIDGATALLPVYSAFAAAVYPPGDYDVEDFKSSPVTCSTTAQAYERLINGDVDIIFVAAPSQAQRDAAASAGVELVFTPIGREAFVFFVNHRNPVSGLSLEEVRGIYSGEITNWNEVGGRNQSIRAFQREEGSGSQSALVRMMDGAQLMRPPAQNITNGMTVIARKVTDYKNYGEAIGFSFRYYVTEMLGGNEIKLLEIDGVYPSEQSIRDGSYPQASSFYAVTRKQPHDNAARLVEWILSPEGQYIVERTGYVGVE